jgi:urea transport system substrate-binding protein
MKSTRVAVGLVAGSVLVSACIFGCGQNPNALPIKVGVLHSLTGTNASSEQPVVDATMLAIEEVNAAGGILGRRIEPIVRDGQSDAEVFAREADRLLTTDGVAVIFGCWTSACRKTVKPVVEKHDTLLFYPLQYEGLESSRSIVYTGSAPNQQIIPAVRWSLDHLGRRFFLVGSDYIFPRAANAIIRDELGVLNGEVVGEDYILLGSQQVDDVVARIAKVRPDVILNTINGETNAAFFKALARAGIRPDQVPVMSFRIGESELQQMEPETVTGDYAARSYFQTLDRDENRAFVSKFRARFGARRVLSDPMEAAYDGVHLWALSVGEAGSTATDEVRRVLGDQSFPAPQGIVYVDAATQHLWQSVRIGRIRRDGQFDIVWDAGTAIRPIPYPIFRSREAWEDLLNGFYKQWGGNWSNPQGQKIARSGN